MASLWPGGVGLGHVGGIGGVAAPERVAEMRGDALAAMEDLDGGGGEPRIDEFVPERMVARVPGPRGQDDGVVMLREIVVGALVSPGS